MFASETSPFVMALITLAAVVSLFAWWLSVRNSRRTRELIEYLERNQGSFWGSQQTLSRKLTAIGIIEAYRRSAQNPDPEFSALYQARKRGLLAQISAIVLAATLIGLVLIGTRFWGWSW
jgi:hypothetical protein